MIPRPSGLYGSHALAHLLLAHQRNEIQRQLAESCWLYGCAPWDVFFLLLDLRAEFGRQVALHFRSRDEIDRAVLEADAIAEPPIFSVPMQLQGGLEIIELFVPDLREQVLHRPPKTVVALVVDADGHPSVGIMRLLDRRVVLS